MDQIRAGIIGAISGVPSNIARIIQAPGTSIARVISAYSSKNEE